ncbi:hypothetical protein I3U63_23315 [Mycobacteroides abscessus subsp. massiliense]|uniref:hypothetical protein n=1 Tax=Mycobacteroides abscessus TaxID=36809 RepID=UPI0019D155E8|nr:hypothetical protein [Mycobacteroides abscessus]MBN7324447.1 hypothetical protein [Mycobacteroides abscessus subsp. massiliense]
MSAGTTYPPQPTQAAGPAYGNLGATPYPGPPAPDNKPPRRGKLLLALAGTAVAAGLLGAILGTVTGLTIGANNAEPHTPAAKPPTAAEIEAANVQVCTRYAAAYVAMPSQQNSGMDILPIATEIADAVRDNPNADPRILDAVSRVAELTRQQAAALSREPQKGFVRPPTDWTAKKANEADEKAWNLCQGVK